MPLYEYRCSTCGEQFDKLVSMSTPTSDIECPSCGARESERLLSQVAVFAGGNAGCGPVSGGT